MNVSDVRPVISPLPDDNTAEAVMYGPAYRYAKSARWYLDEVDEEIDRRIEELKSELNDIEWCAGVLRMRPMLIYARDPPVSDPSKIRDLWTLRQIVNYGTAKRDLKLERVVAEMYCTIQGVDQHARQYTDTGVPESIWKSSTLGISLPIEYESIRTIKDQDERLSAADVEDMYVTMDSAQRLAEAEGIRRDTAEYLDRFNDDDEEGEAEDDGWEDDVPDESPRAPPIIPIFREVEIPGEGPESDGYWTDEVDEDEYVEEYEEVDGHVDCWVPVMDGVSDVVSRYVEDPIAPFLRRIVELSEEILPREVSA